LVSYGLISLGGYIYLSNKVVGLVSWVSIKIYLMSGKASNVILYIFANMAKQKNNIITIDLNQWQTPVNYAIDNDLNFNTLLQHIKRTREGTSKTPLDVIEIPELNNLTLIKKIER
jgi:hypothetical protein